MRHLSERDQRLSALISSSHQKTSRRWRTWKRFGAPKYVVRIIRYGFQVPFARKPTPFFQRSPPPADLEERRDRPAMWTKLISSGVLYKWSNPDQPPTYLSPLRGEKKMVEGVYSGKLRPITNLRKLNSYVQGRKLRYETLTNLPSMTTRSTWATVSDFSNFFQSFSLHRSCHRFFCVQAPSTADTASTTETYTPSAYYTYASLPQGFSLSPWVVAKCTRWILEWIRKRPGCTAILYVDDCLLLAPRSTIRALTRAFRAMVHQLGLVINLEGGFTIPKQDFVFLGLRVDLRLRLFLVPVYKQLALTPRCRQTLLHARPHKMLVPCKAIARLTGTAISLHLAMPTAPYFCRSLHDALKTRTSWRGNVRLPRQALTDIESLATLSQFHQQASFRPPRTTSTLTTDASTRCFGGWLVTPYGETDEVSGLFAKRHVSGQINTLEAIAVLKCLQAFAPLLTGQHIQLFTDNMSVLTVVNKMSPRSVALMEQFRLIYDQLLKLGCTMQAPHITTLDNFRADTLSRIRDQTEYGYSPLLRQLAERTFGLRCTLDCYASARFHQALPYHSRWADAGAAVTNTFRSSWQGHILWITPPLSLVMDTLVKLRSDQCQALLVLPDWPAQPWYPLLLELASDSLVFPLLRYLEESECNEARAEVVKNPKWTFKVWRIR